MPDPKFARYIIHVLPRLPQSYTPTTGHPGIDRLLLWDEALDTMANRRALLPAMMFSDQWCDLDAYLQLRPERFDQLATYIRQGRVWFGPWYRHPALDSDPEILIRNLLLGRQSAQVFGAGENGGLAIETPHLPALFQGFSLQFAYQFVTEPSPAAYTWVSADGSRLPVLTVYVGDNLAEWRKQAADEHQHLALGITGRAPAIYERFQQMRQTLPHDDVFLTNANSLQKFQKYSSAKRVPQQTVWAVARPWQAEVAYTRMLVEGQMPPIPWLALQKRYRHADEDVAWQAAIEGILATKTTIDDTMLCNREDFTILAIKPREDGEAGMVVRGVNIGQQRREISLKPWRKFNACEIVQLDERPTGGKLAVESDGSISFMATPYRILTFWFHDEA